MIDSDPPAMDDREPYRESPDALRAPVAPGRVDFDLPLGPLLVRVIGLPATWDGFVAPQYLPFAAPVDRGRRPDLEVACSEGEGVFLPLPPPGGATEIAVERPEPGRYRVRSHWQDGWVDVESGTGEMVLTDRLFARFRMSLENYLRVASQLLAIERNCFLMHAGGLLDAGRCLLFFGPSGAGKSTATAMSAPRRALSDDMVLIDVSGETAIAHAVPFYGLFPPTERTRGAFPIGGAFRLRQAPEDRLERLGLARSIATVSASIPFVHELGLSHEGLTALVARLCERVAVYDLHFTRSARFWELIGAL